MAPTVRLALRDWDYLTPLLLGDVGDPRIDLQITRVGTLVDDLATTTAYDGAEISFSRYVQDRAAGCTAVLGVPQFLMRGFRHRCIITAKTSPITRLEDLAGKKIGVTGWQDSGNTWTRAALADLGVGIEDVMWYAGRLTEAHPITDRLGRFARPGRIEAMPGEQPMIAALLDGSLDAVFTPFMPTGFFRPDSAFRHVLSDFRSAEIAYFDRVGYVPGMHILGLKASFAMENPWIASALSDLFDGSLAMWLDKRRKYAETTPWIIQDIAMMDTALGAKWAASGLSANAGMISDFVRQSREQALIGCDLTLTEIFPSDPSAMRG
ncbi:MAG: nitrate ABC transporter substrate-binding protein [Pseudotabrizicola sp.]|uniref:nitrate ABC transporter substrate-binding protein n=1 Tax=Pseudotabrizicola sp. TaxID=2939647 RepID=UPI002719113F|nr:nitrate ABC transporter substrate-binding protein [Pseudotabrizicola sp.]MDO9636975.1 nitrate ABC transporter substrate-binding protein [Pseudotabrizicola sp.]